MRSLTDEAKEIVRVFMADGKVATRKMIAEQVEKNISRPNEYRVNILNGVIKVMTENHEWDVVERGKYQLGKGLPKRTPEELAVLYLMDCKKNMGSLCSIDETETSEDKRGFIMRVADSVSEIDKLLLKFNGGKVEVEKAVPPVEKAEQDKPETSKAEQDKTVEKTEADKPVEKPVEEKEEPSKEAETEKEQVKEDKPVEKKEEAGKKEEVPVKESPKEGKKEVKAPAKKVETVKKEKAPVKKAETVKKVEEKKLEVPAVVKEEPKTEKAETKAEKTA